MPRLLARCLATTFLVLALPSSAQPLDLTRVTTRAGLDAALAATSDSSLRQALQAHASAILTAAAQRAHAEAVIEAIKIGLGRTERTNTTPESLKRIAGGELSAFDSLRLVDLAIPNAGPHDHRKVGRAAPQV